MEGATESGKGDLIALCILGAMTIVGALTGVVGILAGEPEALWLSALIIFVGWLTSRLLMMPVIEDFTNGPFSDGLPKHKSVTK